MERVTKKLAKKVADKYGLDIMSIITMIMSLFENCQSRPQAVARALKRGRVGIFEQSATYRAIKSEFPNLNNRAARNLARDLLRDAEDEDENDLAAACEECQSGALLADIEDEEEESGENGLPPESAPGVNDG